MAVINQHFFESIAIKRPVGSVNNRDVAERLVRTARSFGCAVERLPFACKTWTNGPSSLRVDGRQIDIGASPFSRAVKGEGALVFIEDIGQLRVADIKGELVMLHGAIAKEPIMPKDFPYYYPAEHQEMISLLENGQPLAVVAVTGKHPMCGLEPFALFEDGNFLIPAAYTDKRALKAMDGRRQAEITIDSTVAEAFGEQPLFFLAGEEETRAIIICAHMDTAYNTPGALDNASGVCVMLRLMELLKDRKRRRPVVFIPFNGEDYYAVSGQQAYFYKYPPSKEDIALVLNIDDMGHVGSKNALSTYCMDARMEEVIDELIARDAYTVKGRPWYESDHTMFAQQGIRCLALASSDLTEETVKLTHTPADTPDKVDFALVEQAAQFAVKLFERLGYIGG